MIPLVSNWIDYKVGSRELVWRFGYRGIAHDRVGCWYQPNRQVRVCRLGVSPENCGRGRLSAGQSAGTSAVCSPGAVRYLSAPSASDWPLCRWTRTASVSKSEPFRARRIDLLHDSKNDNIIAVLALSMFGIQQIPCPIHRFNWTEIHLVYRQLLAGPIPGGRWEGFRLYSQSNKKQQRTTSPILRPASWFWPVEVTIETHFHVDDRLKWFIIAVNTFKRSKRLALS